MIKAILFDYFGVISSDEYWQYVQADRQVDTNFRTYTDDVNAGRMHWIEFMQKVAEATHTTLEQVSAMYATEKINPLMVGLIHELHKNYKTGLVTNAHHEFVDSILEQNHLSEIFDVTVVSSRLGIVKPDPRIFEFALEKLEVEPQEVVYIDDLERHVASANALGIHAFQYLDFEQTKAEINRILQPA